VDQDDDHEKEYRAKRGLNDCRDNARTEMDPELWKYPARNEGAYDPHDKVADEAKACTPDHLVRKPTSGDADNQYDEKVSPDRFILRPHARTARGRSATTDTW
jgi:hypothetical protein